MPIRFFDTYSRSVREFVPRNPSNASIYTCGPTVYSRAHIGNFRAYIFEDLLQRHLESHGYHIQRVMNLTDVDDKTIAGARAANISLDEYTRPFKRAFFDDLDTLRIKPANEFPQATDFIARMIAMISELMARDFAYQAEDRSVYFRIKRFPDYGKLAHLNLDELRPSGRVRSDEYDKENIGDFALWKAWDEADGEVKWEAPWGSGRPGWHIECSAMATALLGDEIDIHCGGVDNIFPHHEAEIAQSESCTGKKFVRFWLHCAHLLVDNQKMSKSLGNFYTLPDVMAKGYTGREVRYALLRVHYRAPLNFTWAGMEESRQALRRIDEWRQRLRELSVASAISGGTEMQPGQEFQNALDEDLNISAALGFVFESIRQTNREMDANEMSVTSARRWLGWWAEINKTLGLDEPANALPAEIENLANQRAEARLARNWGASDQLREQLKARGWDVRDTKDGQKITPRAGIQP